MREHQKYYQVLPEKVLCDLPVISELLAPEIKGFNVDCLKEVISIVAKNLQKNKDTAPLRYKLIREFVPQGHLYLKGLLDAGIVIRLGQFKFKIECYKYRFAPEYISKYKTLPLENAKLVLRIKEAWDNYKKREVAKSIWGRSEQKQWLHRLTINPGYEKYLEENSYSVAQFNAAIGSAAKIQNGEIFYKVDNTSKRFHSNITNISKDLRPFLRINNEPLVNIDVKNCQPYLSTIILTNPSKVSWLTKNTAFALCLQTLKVSHNKDVKDYIYLVANGQLYEFMMAAFANEGLILNRQETKRQILRILFARNRPPNDPVNRLARDVFKKTFPTVHRIFSKVRGSTRGNKFENFKRFSILLQRIESYLMLDIILKRIYRELPGTIAVTIHDSIMTGILTNNVEAVRKIINDELTIFVGIAPKIEIERRLEDKEEGIREKRNRIHYLSTVFVNN
jgi:hypothetical protein